ncbi:MAG: hypothetical protein EPN73_17885 [Paraburkholderia sp.]|uniref:hypothetical protein n=1 Tax=Paraburkholderia sp. TaxID=1926495 RepID=UPI001210AE8A|nr:hypothetical protein [Paraburkholderia sp.]TAL94232.1 MAG: hypothetical protein EPN73_17885 [Paraburkholderia sp.]
MTTTCLLFFIFVYTTASAECADQQQANANLTGLNGVSVRAVACSESDTSGDVSIDVFLDRKRPTTLHTDYESPAYVLTLDTSITFDDDKSQGLGVSTGKGRDGTGMHYWKVPRTGVPIIDLGDAPALEPDRFMHGAFSTLVSSTGMYQSIRYFYEIKHDRLVATQAVGFSPVNARSYAVTLMEITYSGESVAKQKRTLSIERANLCMNGKIACW